MMQLSDCIGVVGSKCMQIAQLTKTTLDVCHMNLNIILEATGNDRNLRNDVLTFTRAARIKIQ